MKNQERALRVVDVLIAIPLIPAAAILKFVRRAGLQRLPICRWLLLRIGVIPVRNHYYEPWVDSRTLTRPLHEPRPLRGIDWRPDRQLGLLRRCTFGDELAHIEDPAGTPNGFRFENAMFEHGDAEMLYNLVRLRKPRRVFEIGSGNSTLVAAKAIRANEMEEPEYECEHVCIEPYENSWLDGTGVRVVRQPVEHLGTEFFGSLTAGDILFIDSSHVIKPQRDVLFEYLEVLPSLAPGVLVHIHDIFSPRDYPREWALGRHRFWNEQYLVEAFLSGGTSWNVVVGMNYLHHAYPDELRAACPHLRKEHEPGSLYIERAELNGAIDR